MKASQHIVRACMRGEVIAGKRPFVDIWRTFVSRAHPNGGRTECYSNDGKTHDDTCYGDGGVERYGTVV